MAKRYWRVGVALGAGSARGLAHIGVLKVFEKEGIPVDFIAGSSIGAVVGACYACRSGKAKDVEGLVYSFSWKYVLKLVTLFMPRLKSPEPEEVLSFLRQRLQNRKLENLSIPTAVVATDLFSGRKVVFKRGDMFLALAASIAIPGVFSPVYYNGRFLIDGGVVDPVPVDVVKNMGAEVVIGIDVSPELKLKFESYKKRVYRSFWRRFKTTVWGEVAELFYQTDEMEPNDVEPIRKEIFKELPPPSSKEVLLQAIDIMFRKITEDTLNRSYVDIVIRPDVGDVSSNAFNKAPEIIKLGEEAARASIGEIKGLLQKRWYHYVVGKRR